MMRCQAPTWEAGRHEYQKLPSHALSRLLAESERRWRRWHWRLVSRQAKKEGGQRLNVLCCAGGGLDHALCCVPLFSKEQGRVQILRGSAPASRRPILELGYLQSKGKPQKAVAECGEEASWGQSVAAGNSRCRSGLAQSRTQGTGVPFGGWLVTSPQG